MDPNPMHATDDDLVELGAAVSLGSLAAQFVTEPGRYPEFVAWCNTQTTNEDAAWLPLDRMADISTYLRGILALITHIRTAQITIRTTNDQI